MFRKRLLTLFFGLVLIGTTAGPAIAQTPNASSMPPLDQLDGIRAAASRTYALDVEAMLAATPDLAPEEFTQGVRSASIMVLHFDTPENAAAAFGIFSTSIVDDLPMLAQGGTPEVTNDPLTDTGDQASVATLHTSSGDEETWLRFVTMQQGDHLFVISALTGAEDLAILAENLAALVVSEGEFAGDDAIFVAEGGSTGGLWGFMPEAGHDVLQGLIPVVDQILYPAPGQQ